MKNLIKVIKETEKTLENPHLKEDERKHLENKRDALIIHLMMAYW